MIISFRLAQIGRIFLLKTWLYCRSIYPRIIKSNSGKEKEILFLSLLSRFNFIHCCDLWAEQWMTCYTRNHLLSWRNEWRSIHVRLLRVRWAIRGQNGPTDRKNVLKIVKSTKKWDFFWKNLFAGKFFYCLRFMIFIINYICLLHR